jgi:tripeptide aminopeptidase
MKKDFLKDVLSVQSYSGKEHKMNAYIRQWCKDNNLKCRSHKGNLYIVKGNADLYPCYVAHTDTVHPLIKGMDRLNIIEHKGALIALDDDHKQTGIGGDDKVGIYIALRMLLRLPACKVAFFHSEEIGCVGSNDADIRFFRDCKFILQADRRGYGDWITDIGGGNISSKEFQDAIKHIADEYGYKFKSGAMTDVEALSKKSVGVSCANVSCGYYHPHTNAEYVVIEEVGFVEDMFYDVAKKLDKRYDNTYVNKYRDEVYSSRHDYYPYRRAADYAQHYDGYDYYDDYDMRPSEASGVRHTHYTDSSGNSYITHHSHGLMKTSNMYCPSCVDVRVHERIGNKYFKFYCENCQKLFEADKPLSTEQAIQKLYSDPTIPF